MIEAVYSARFLSNAGLFGVGIVVMDGGKLHGGDLDYVYRGKYRLIDTVISATVDVDNYTGNPDSVFGSVSHLWLPLIGVFAAHGFTLSGTVDGQPNLMIRIDLTKISELVDQ